MQDLADKAKAQKKNNELLILASARGYYDDVVELVKREADVKAKDKKKVSALHYACGRGRLEVVKYFQTKGVDLDVEDAQGRTPVHWAVLGGHAAVLDYLLSKGAYPDAFDSNDDSPLHLAARAGREELVRCLLGSAAKSNVGDANSRGLTPLGEAIAGSHIPCAELLIAQGGASVSVQARGWSLLHVAACLASPAALTFLLTQGSLSPNDRSNDEGIGPLHAAAASGNEAAVKLLLDKGADSLLQATDGRVAADFLPSSNAALSKLLHKNGSTQPARPAGASADPGPGSNPSLPPAVAKFQAQAPRARAAAVERWAETADAGARAGKLQGLWRVVGKHVEELHTLQAHLSIQQAALELLEDDDFQRDADGGNFERIVEEVKANPAAAAKYQDQVALAASLAKLRRFQLLCKARGQPTLLATTLRSVEGIHWQATNEGRLQDMLLLKRAHISAACAAACAGSEAAAEEAARACMTDMARSRQPPAQSLPSSQAAAPPSLPATSSPAERGTGTSAASTATAAASAEPSAEPVQLARGAAPGRPPRQPSAAAAGSSAEAGSGLHSRGSKTERQRAQEITPAEEEDEDDLLLQRPRKAKPEPRWGEVYTWRAFYLELRKQLLLAGLSAGLAISVLWLFGFPLPWTRQDTQSAEVKA